MIASTEINNNVSPFERLDVSTHEFADPVEVPCIASVSVASRNRPDSGIHNVFTQGREVSVLVGEVMSSWWK